MPLGFSTQQFNRKLHPHLICEVSITSLMNFISQGLTHSAICCIFLYCFTMKLISLTWLSRTRYTLRGAGTAPCSREFGSDCGYAHSYNTDNYSYRSVCFPNFVPLFQAIRSVDVTGANGILLGTLLSPWEDLHLHLPEWAYGSITYSSCHNTARLDTKHKMMTGSCAFSDWQP